MSLRLGETLIAGANPVPKGAMTYKGSVLQANLPTIGQQVGDYYKLTDVAPSIYAGQCAIWNGVDWDYSSGNMEVDGSLSTTSTNPVQNRIITNELNSCVKTTGDQRITGIKKFGEIWAGDPDTGEFGKIFKDGMQYAVNATTVYDYYFPTKAGTFALTSDVNDCLPKSGGTMTGAINLKLGPNNGINGADNSDQVNINGGKTYEEGGYFSIYGKNAYGNPGGVSMTAFDGTNRNSFNIKADGTFTNNDKPIEITDFNGSSLWADGSNGCTVTIDFQTRIEHRKYYEYRFMVTVSGGTRSSSGQTQVGHIRGFVGTNVFSHQSVPCWTEGGNDNVTGLIYGGTTDTSLGLYIGKTTTTENIRMNINIIRLK